MCWMSGQAGKRTGEGRCAAGENGRVVLASLQGKVKCAVLASRVWMSKGVSGFLTMDWGRSSRP